MTALPDGVRRHPVGICVLARRSDNPRLALRGLAGRRGDDRRLHRPPRVVAGLTAYLPERRASRIDPVLALTGQ